MLPVEQAHRIDHILSPGSIFHRLAHLRPDLQAQRDGSAKFLVIATSVDGSEHSKKRFAGFQRHWGLVLRSSRRRAQQESQAKTGNQNERLSNPLSRWSPSVLKHTEQESLSNLSNKADELEVVYELLY